MEILDEVKRYLEILNGIQGFLDKAEPKGRIFRQGDYTFAGIR